MIPMTMGEKVLCSAARQTAAVALLANINEPLHNKTNKVACEPSEDSGQPGHPPSLISLCCPHEESLGP